METLDRRQFLSGAAGVGAAAGALHLRIPRHPKMPARAASIAGATRQASGMTTSVSAGPLVLCILTGGNDGLNTVVPYESGDYRRLRGQIAIPGDQVLPLGEHDGEALGFHPSLTGMYELFQAGQVAVILGVEYPDPNYSHFVSMDIWQTAQLSGDLASGWVGRWLDHTGTDPFRALSVGAILPAAFVGDEQQASTLNDSTSGNSQMPGQDPQFLNIYKNLMRPYGGELELSRDVGAAGLDLLTIGAAADRALTKESVPPSVTSRGSGDIGNQLDIVAELIEYGLPTKAYAVGWNGFDTHADQLDTHAGLLSQLDAAVQNFMAVFPTPVKGKNPVLLIHSEFGRRPNANGSAGTDHGSAGVVFVVGPGVKGGFYGSQPSLSRFDPYGNLIWSTDFRRIYATILDQVLDGPTARILGGSFKPLEFLN